MTWGWEGTRQLLPEPVAWRGGSGAGGGRVAQPAAPRLTPRTRSNAPCEEWSLRRALCGGENAAQICPQRAEDFNATGWAWGEGGWSSRGLESCVTGGLHRLPGGDVRSVPACVAGPRREERGGGIALPARGEARRWPGSQPGLWGWREGPGLGGDLTLPNSPGHQVLLGIYPPRGSSCHHLPAGAFRSSRLGQGGSTWPQTSRTNCGGSAGSGSCSLPLAEESQASIKALLVLIFMINIVFPLMVEISCALSLPQFTSLPASGVLPDSGEKKIRCQNSYLKSPLGKRPQILSFLPKIDSKT